MATKLSAGDKRMLANVGIEAKNQEEAREIIISKLEKQGFEDLEEMDFNELLDIYSGIYADEDEVEEADEEDREEEMEDETEEDDELPEEDEEEGEEDDAEELPEEDEEVDEEEELDALAEEVKKEDEEVEAKKSENKKAAKTEEMPKKPRRTAKLNPRDNEEDRVKFDIFKELFPEEEHLYCWISNAGVSIKHNGKNSKRVMLSIENATNQADGSIKCNCYFPTMMKSVEVLEETDYEIKRAWNNTPYISGITFEDVIELAKKLEEHIFGEVKKIDKKMGDNREKLEKQLKGEKKSEDATAPKKSKKTKKATDE